MTLVGCKKIAGAALTCTLLTGLPTRADDLSITIDNITDAGGAIHWALFDTAEGFASGDNPVSSAISRVAGDSLRVTLHDLPAGRYALKLFHDANGNGELDSNALGLPVEGYGFSNNAGRFGPASFDDAAFALDGDTAIEIRVR